MLAKFDFRTIRRTVLFPAFGILALAMAPIAGASTTEGPFTIKSIIIGGYGAHIEVSPVPAGCTGNWTGTQMVIPRDAINFKDLLAGFLAAQSQGKQVVIWHDPQGDGTCSFGNQKLINTIQIKS